MAYPYGTGRGSRGHNYGTDYLEALSTSACYSTQLSNKTRQYSPKLSLIFHKLDAKLLRIIVHADESFTNFPDHKTHLGFVILLLDDTRMVNWLHYRSETCKRVVRSVLAGETHSFVDAFEASNLIRYQLQNNMQQRVPFCILTDSDSLFKVKVQSSNMKEKHVMIHIQADLEA